MRSCIPHQAVSAYCKAARETATPRQLEAELLLKAAANPQRVLDSWTNKPLGLSEALLYNRRLWIVFIDAVIRDDNKLPIAVRQNVLNLGAFVMAETFSLMTKPKPDHLHRQDCACDRLHARDPDGGQAAHRRISPVRRSSASMQDLVLRIGNRLDEAMPDAADEGHDSIEVGVAGPSQRQIPAISVIRRGCLRHRAGRQRLAA